MTTTDASMSRTFDAPALRPKLASLPRLLGPAAVVAVGAALLVALFVPRLFSRAPALEDLTDDLRPLMTEQSISALEADLDGIDAANEEFGAKVVPTVAAALGQTPEELSAFIGDQFPDVAAGVAALPAISEQFRGLVGVLDAEQQRFQATDEIPTADLPPQTVPWAILVLGIGALAIGVWLGLTRTRPAAIGAIVFGVVVLAATLATGLQGKANDADALGRNVRPVFASAVVDDARQALTTVDAMATELEGKALPAVAAVIGLPADQIPAFVAEQFPALDATLAGLPATAQRFSSAIDLVDQNRTPYDRVSKVPFGRVISTVMFGAAAILVIGLLQLVRRKPTSAH